MVATTDMRTAQTVSEYGPFLLPSQPSCSVQRRRKFFLPKTVNFSTFFLCSFTLAMSSESGLFCRICHESGPSAATGDQLVRPCLCRGTLSCAHSDCISQWVTSRARSHGTLRSACEICRTDYTLSVRHANRARFLSFSRLAHLCT